jgi:hypothetical protein
MPEAWLSTPSPSYGSSPWLTEASYIIYQEGGVTYAKNGRTGAVDFSGTSAPVIQAAYNALSAGGRIHLKLASYTLAAVLDFELKPLMLTAEEGTTLVWANGINANMFMINNVAGFLIEGLTFDFNRAGQVGSWDGIVITGSRLGLIENCQLLNCGGHAVVPVNCSDISGFNLYFSNCQSQFSPYIDCVNCVVLNSRMVNGGHITLSGRGCGAQNCVMDTLTDGVYLHDHGFLKGCVVRGSTDYNVVISVGASETHTDMIVEGCILENSTVGGGIEFCRSMDDAVHRNIRIINNVIQGNASNGIYLHAANPGVTLENIVVMGNVIRNNGGWGINIGLPTNYTEVYENIIRGNASGSINQSAGVNLNGFIRHNIGYLTEIPNYFFKQRTGITLSSNIFGSSTTRVHLPLDVLRAAPFYVPQRCTMDRIGIRVIGAGAAGAKIRVGLYRDDGNFYPSTLVVDGGELDATGTGVRLATVNVTLEPGVYWLAGVANDATIDWSAANSTDCIYLISSNYAGDVGWQVAQAYGALPDPFPGGGATSVYVPLPFYRISAWLEE